MPQMLWIELNLTSTGDPFHCLFVKYALCKCKSWPEIQCKSICQCGGCMQDVCVSSRWVSWAYQSNSRVADVV